MQRTTDGPTLWSPRRRRTARAFGQAALGALILLHAAPSLGQEVACADLPTPIYGLGGSAAKPLIASFATALSASGDPISVVYQSPGACFAINAFIDDTPLTGTGTYWTADGTESICTLPTAGEEVDFGYMGNTASFCPGVDALPSGVIDVPGPVTSWNLVVPNASSQQSISSEALYVVYGFGNESQASPWTDEAQLLSRNPTSAALLAIAAASKLPAERFLGVDAKSNGNMITLLSGSTNPEAALGFVSGEVADANRDSVRTLAYQHAGQFCGYWPDSSSTAFDKVNIREGRYWLWAYHHFFGRIDGAGAYADANVERFIELITATAEDDEGIPVLDLIIDNGTVPQCAMSVNRTSDYSELVPYEPEAPCGCYFDFRVTGSSTCQLCTETSDCSAGAPVCRRGFCEER